MLSLGANSLLQASVDGYFILPNTINNYLVNDLHSKHISTDHPQFEEVEKEVRQHIDRVLAVKGQKTVDHFHRELGKVMWKECAMSRNKQGLENAIKQIQNIRDAFWSEVKVTGAGEIECPEGISITNIAEMNNRIMRARFLGS